MDVTYKYSTGILPKDEIELFTKLNKGWKVTGETLIEEFTDRTGRTYGTTYVVMTGKFTRYGMCRDCGDHYIIARYSRWDRIDKVTFKMSFDVDDE